MAPVCMPGSCTVPDAPRQTPTASSRCLVCAEELVQQGGVSFDMLARLACWPAAVQQAYPFLAPALCCPVTENLSHFSAMASSGTPEEEQHKYLPAPEATSTATLDVTSGETVKLDHLGPLVGAVHPALCAVCSLMLRVGIYRHCQCACRVP